MSGVGRKGNLIKNIAGKCCHYQMYIKQKLFYTLRHCRAGAPPPPAPASCFTLITKQLNLDGFWKFFGFRISLMHTRLVCSIKNFKLHWAYRHTRRALVMQIIIIIRWLMETERQTTLLSLAIFLAYLKHFCLACSTKCGCVHSPDSLHRRR